ncbi:hypothetical protein LXL04_023100 [Taraxacum kok-saghyz]
MHVGMDGEDDGWVEVIEGLYVVNENDVIDLDETINGYGFGVQTLPKVWKLPIFMICTTYWSVNYYASMQSRIRKSHVTSTARLQNPSFSE